MLFAGLLFIALELQGKYGKSYNRLGRQVPDREQARFVAFCVWGVVTALNLITVGFLRRYPASIRVFSISTAFMALFTLYWIWAWVYPYGMK